MFIVLILKKPSKTQKRLVEVTKIHIANYYFLPPLIFPWRRHWGRYPPADDNFCLIHLRNYFSYRLPIASNHLFNFLLSSKGSLRASLCRMQRSGWECSQIVGSLLLKRKKFHSLEALRTRAYQRYSSSAVSTPRRRCWLAASGVDLNVFPLPT